MKEAHSIDFISILSEDKPQMILFRHLEDDVSKIKATLKELDKTFPLLPSFDYVVDASESNYELAHHLGADKTPILMFFKNGNFSRYKDKMFTKKSLATFIGSKKIYSNSQN